jgi:hypothetical protein
MPGNEGGMDGSNDIAADNNKQPLTDEASAGLYSRETSTSFSLVPSFSAM